MFLSFKNLIPLKKFSIHGNSMNPEFKDGDLILTHSLLYKPSVGDVVAVMYNKKTLIKRISKIFKDTIEIIGDNKEESTDSRSFGEINKNQILGKVIMKI